MIVQYLVALYFLIAIAISAPVINQHSTEISPPETTPTNLVNDLLRPNITLPESFGDSINYETRGGGFEGDMFFPSAPNPSGQDTDKGVAIFGPHRWPNNVIPYDLSGITSWSDRAYIINAMNTLMYVVGTPVAGKTTRQSCVYFRPRLQNEQDFIRIAYGRGCASTVGFTRGTDMNMQLESPGCFHSGTIQHELLHVLGFYHEQSRPDRDSYVSIHYENLLQLPFMKNNFDKYTWGREVLNQHSPYDYESIMHYGPTFFSRNGRPTVVAKRGGVRIGQRDGLSAIDIAEVRAFYGC